MSIEITGLDATVTQDQDLFSRNKTQIQERTMRREASCLSKFFQYLFYAHFLLITVLVIFLIVHGVLSAAHTHHFHPKNWYLPVLSSTACAGIIGFAWQEFTRFSPSRTLRAAFWLSPLFTCAFGILLVSIGTPWSLAASVIALVSSVLQSLYACWVSTRFEHASRILTVSITDPPKIRAAVIISIIICTLYSSFLMCGIGGATGRNMVYMLFIFLILGSFAWTMQIVKNMMQVTVSGIKYMQFLGGMDVKVDFSATVKAAAKYSMGSVCIGSIIVPVLGVIRGLARGVNLVSGEADEFMFSCASCCSGVASTIVVYGNRWGFVHVGVYYKGIVQASMDTWEMFTRAGMEKLIDSDLTSSFCFLCGVATGSVCALVGGTWAIVVQNTYATEVSIYTFFIGYFMSRVAMAWVQGSVAAYFVAYAENPQSQRFDTTISEYFQELQRSQA